MCSNIYCKTHLYNNLQICIYYRYISHNNNIINVYNIIAVLPLIENIWWTVLSSLNATD